MRPLSTRLLVLSPSGHSIQPHHSPGPGGDFGRLSSSSIAKQKLYNLVTWGRRALRCDRGNERILIARADPR